MKKSKGKGGGSLSNASSEYAAVLFELIASASPDADLLQKILSRKPIDAEVLLQLVATVRHADYAGRQSAAADKRHRARKMAIAHVRDLWEVHPDGESKAAFSERMVSHVRRKFKVEVKAATISRDWLRGALWSSINTRPDDVIAYAKGRYFSKPPAKRKISLKAAKPL